MDVLVSRRSQPSQAVHALGCVHTLRHFCLAASPHSSGSSVLQFVFVQDQACSIYCLCFCFAFVLCFVWWQDLPVSKNHQQMYLSHVYVCMCLPPTACECASRTLILSGTQGVSEWLSFFPIEYITSHLDSCIHAQAICLLRTVASISCLVA